MRATAVLVVAFCCCCVFAAGGARAARAVRVFVTPIAQNDESAKTLTRAVETALGTTLRNAEIVTPSALDTAIEIELVRDCAGTGDDGNFGASCASELAEALDVDVIARPSLGRLGDQLVLTLTLLDGERAVVVAQGQRRAAADAPDALLDAIPGLVREVARGADLEQAAKQRGGVPVAPLIVAGSGVVVAGASVVALAVRGGLSGDYANGTLSRDDARFYEAVDVPFLYGGIAGAVVGGVAVLGGLGAAAWSAVAPEE